MTPTDRAKAFLARMRKRNPSAAAEADRRLAAPESAADPKATKLEAVQRPKPTFTLESVVALERPVLLVRDGKLQTDLDLSDFGQEAKQLVAHTLGASRDIEALLPRVGRIDVSNFVGGLPFVGTAWFVAEDVLVTNRHVAQLIASRDGDQFVFHSGTHGRPLEPRFSTAHDLAADDARSVPIARVIYIEPDSGPDIAFLSVKHVAGQTSAPIPIATDDVGDDDPLCVIGYPARASRDVIPDQRLMNKLFQQQYDVKRVAPGYPMPSSDPDYLEHDAATLGGNSGSVVVAGGKAVGLHFAGAYREANYAVQRRKLRDFVDGKRWTRLPEVEAAAAPPAAPPQPPPTAPPAASTTVATSDPGEVEVVVPVRLRISLGTPTVGGGPSSPPSGGAPKTVTLAMAHAAVRAFWSSRPAGVIGARVGFEADGDRIGDTPFVAASVSPPRLVEVAASGPREVLGVPVHYLPAEVDEQVAALHDGQLELEAAVSSIQYDDANRDGEGFSLDPVEQPMKLTLHVGPEHSWDVLEKFLLTKKRQTTYSAMYQFRAPYIEEAIRARLKANGRCHMALDPATFAEAETDEFDARKDFAELASSAGKRFERIVVPKGKLGLVAYSYHMKVTVRGDTFWLSSGNWKSSSQPEVTPAELANITTKDLDGNREWHVIVENRTLATRLKNHIAQDITRARELGGAEVPTKAEDRRRSMDDDVTLFVPSDRAVSLEAANVRPPPSKALAPLEIDDTIRVQPLLTPDERGRVYGRAVLRTIRSAKRRLLFQIPYIAIARSPDEHRGILDSLLEALVEKLLTLDDARLILRIGTGSGKEASSPYHVAWFLKSRGVDIHRRVRGIPRTHTKGLVVDDDRAMVGSQNWSASGVTLNRDASLLFHDARVAAYYAEAFEVDWARATHLRPHRFVKEAPESAAARFVEARLSDFADD
ncbi:MAG: trypsin-like peptidase domain-containing protein [Sandaracinaceae bacterium]|nr:trypsin-like peptidase domain-containing protein [Sandaracinaceae bacterium]